MRTVVLRVPTVFVRFALRSSHFQIVHILGFPSDSHVKISKCHQLKSKKSISLHSLMVSNGLTKFGWDMKTVGEVAF